MQDKTHFLVCFCSPFEAETPSPQCPLTEHERIVNSQLICSLIFLNYTAWAPLGNIMTSSSRVVYTVYEDQRIRARLFVYATRVCLHERLDAVSAQARGSCENSPSFFLHRKAASKGGRGCKSNKPVIVSPTSAPPLCCTHCLRRRTHCQAFCPAPDQRRVHDLDSSATIAAHVIHLCLCVFLSLWRRCRGPSHDQILHKLGYPLDVLGERKILDWLVERKWVPAHLGFGSSLVGVSGRGGIFSSK